MIFKRDRQTSQYKRQAFWLYAMAVLYVMAGINHFANPALYISIMPPWLPYPLGLVYISGAFEICLGVLLLPLFTRKIAAAGIILLLIAVFPANVQMLLNFIHESSPYIWAAALRLPLQIVLIRWAYIYYKSPMTVNIQNNVGG